MQRSPRPAMCLLLLTTLSACGVSPAGSEEATRSHFDSEFHKWMAGKDSEVSTMTCHAGLQPPISYDIRSVTNDDPAPLAFDRSGDLPEEWREWPAYRFNVAIEWKSEAGSPMETVTTCRLTWNSNEKRWYVNERF